MDTFSPESNGWVLQRGFPMRPRYAVAEDERELGNITSTALSEKEFRVFTLNWRANTRDAAEYARSFISRHRGPAGRFLYAFPEFVATPDAAAALEAVSGGAQAQRTIHLRFAWKNSAGTTKASPSGSFVVPLNNLIKATFPVYPPSVTQLIVYATESGAGSEQEQATLTNQGTWTQPDAPLLVGNPVPPAANTATETPTVKLVPGSYSLVRGRGTSYELALELEEVY